MEAVAAAAVVAVVAVEVVVVVEEVWEGSEDSEGVANQLQYNQEWWTLVRPNHMGFHQQHRSKGTEFPLDIEGSLKVHLSNTSRRLSTMSSNDRVLG